MADRIDGRSIALSIREEVAGETADLVDRTGIRPGLAAILVGDDPASASYVRSKGKACAKAAIHSETLHLPASLSQDELVHNIYVLNGRKDIHGILIQLPLPSHLDERTVLGHVTPDKDVDGLHSVNLGRLLAGEPGPRPCTPAGIMEMLTRSGIQISGKNAVVIGRSNIVGKPIAMMLMQSHATVTICHSRTRDLPAVASKADVLVAAIGRPAFVTSSFIGEGAVVVDVGINRLTERQDVVEIYGESHPRLDKFDKKGSTIVGDVHELDVQKRAFAYTPVPGGVGLLTIAMLLKNTLESAKSAAMKS